MNTQNLPSQPFFRTPQQRTALARERFFEEGMRPSGLVSETVIQSWDRSRQIGHRSDKLPELEPVGRSALSSALARNEELIQAARLELDQLQAALSGTHCRVLLTDARGVIVHISQHAYEANQSVLDKASRLGVNLVENRLGTNAPGIVVHTGQACLLQAGEHFYNAFQELRCAAAPICGVNGQLAGVLDISTEARDFGFDAMAVVDMFATTIGNRLLLAQSPEWLVLHFQTAPSLLDTPMEGLLGVDTHGRVMWINRVGQSLLGAQPQTPPQPVVNRVLGIDLPALLDLCGASRPCLLQLPSGLGIWARATLQGAVIRHAVGQPGPRPTPTDQASTDSGEAAEAPCAAPESPADGAPSLAQSQQRLIEETLATQHGNVAKTARLLGVSRGLVYRHLRKAPAEDIATGQPGA